MTERADSGQVSDVPAHAENVRIDFRTIFEEYFNYVWNSLRHLGVHPNDLEDLAHEVFIRVHERLDQCDASRSLRPWIFAFVYRVTAEHRRRARLHPEVIGVEAEPSDQGVRADDLLIDREERELAQKALEAVDLDRRAVFVLHELDGVVIPDVASALGIPTNTAYSRLRLARSDFNHAARRLRLQRGNR